MLTLGFVARSWRLPLAFQNDKLDDYNFVPKMKKKPSKSKEKEEFKGLLGDDDDDDDDEEVSFNRKLIWLR